MENSNKYPIFINDRKLDGQEIYHLRPYFSEFIQLNEKELPDCYFFYDQMGLSFIHFDRALGTLI